MTTGRKKYDLSNAPETYPGVFYWNTKTFILVKDNEHYPIPKARMDVMVAESRGHHDEIVKYFKPRIKKPKDPNAPKRTRKKVEEQIVKPQDRSWTWIHPDSIDTKDGHKYTSWGLRI